MEESGSKTEEGGLYGFMKGNGGWSRQRKDEIYGRLRESVQSCLLRFRDCKELATESDDSVVELCAALEDALSFGLREQQTAAMLASALFQNMQEIVTGYAGVSTSTLSSDTTFWDFCLVHLTAYEHERYANLKNICSKYGRGRAFIRSALNEKSLQRYLLIWLDADDELRRFYSPWSLLMDTEMSKELTALIGELDNVLFALTVDNAKLNVEESLKRKEEPLIHSPLPTSLGSGAQEKKLHVIERPIVTVGSPTCLPEPTDAVQSVPLQESPFTVKDETLHSADTVPSKGEFDFLKQSLTDICQEFLDTDASNGNRTPTVVQEAAEDKSETSSECSKSSSAVSSSHEHGLANGDGLEVKLKEMSDRCALLETRVAQLTLQNRQMERILKKYFNESGIDPSSSLASNFLITIPHAQLVKSEGPTRGRGYYIYEIHITMRQNLEHWMVRRRYREFYKLHKTLLRTHPSVVAVDFPPKKHFGNMNVVFVEERRQQLQIYLLNLVEMLQQVEACKTKAELQKTFPFFRER